MVETIVLQYIIVCLTIIWGISLYTSRSWTAVNMWKGKYLTLTREVKKYEKTIKKEFSKQKKDILLKSLNIDENILNEIIDFAEQYGIPESAINALVDNPTIVSNLLSKVSNSGSTENSV